MSDNHFLSDVTAQVTEDEIAQESRQGEVEAPSRRSGWLLLGIPCVAFVAIVIFMYFFGFTNTHLG